MFGLEGKKELKKAEFVFDLEKKLKNPKENRELKERIGLQLVKLKSAQREGRDQEDFDQLESLLQAYISLIKVLGRVPSK